MKEKGNGESPGEAFSQKPIRELLMEVDPRGGPHRRLIPRRAWKPRGRQNSDQYMHFMHLSAECTAQAILLFCFEASDTRLSQKSIFGADRKAGQSLRRVILD